VRASPGRSWDVCDLVGYHSSRRCSVSLVPARQSRVRMFRSPSNGQMAPRGWGRPLEATCHCCTGVSMRHRQAISVAPWLLPAHSRIRKSRDLARDQQSKAGRRRPAPANDADADITEGDHRSGSTVSQLGKGLCFRANTRDSRRVRPCPSSGSLRQNADPWRKGRMTSNGKTGLCPQDESLSARRDRSSMVGLDIQSISCLHFQSISPEIWNECDIN